MKTIIQFGFSRHQPPSGVPVVDCRGITNPWRRDDRATDEQRFARVRSSSKFEPLVQEVLRQFEHQDVVAIGCAWGRHRSGAVAQEVRTRLEHLGQEVQIHEAQSRTPA